MVLSSMPIWSSGVMSTVMAPFDASGIVLRQNGSSSWIDTGVGLFNPITLNWLLGRSCAKAPDATAAANAAPINTRFSMCNPLRSLVKSAKCMPRDFVLNSRDPHCERNAPCRA